MAAPFNPYRHLASCVRAFLRVEITLGAEDRSRSSAFFRVDFADTYMVVGKGGVNTLFWQFGEGKRKIGYPNDLLALLDKLSRQSHVMYLVDIPYLNEPPRRVVTHKAALHLPPSRNSTIKGVNVDGSTELLYEARLNVSGRLTWMRQK